MNILDENILFSQRDQLRARKVHFRQIGMESGRSGMKERIDIIPLPHTLRRPTFLLMQSRVLSRTVAPRRLLFDLA